MQVVQEPAKEGPVGEDESARAPVAEIAGPEEEEEEEAGMMVSFPSVVDPRWRERERERVESY